MDPFKETYELKDAVEILNHPEFVVNRKTLLYIHGYIESSKSPTVQKIIDAYRKRATYNILILDWSTLADGLYPTAVRKSNDVSFPFYHFGMQSMRGCFSVRFQYGKSKMIYVNDSSRLF